MKRTDWMQTYTGARFYPLEPDAELIRIADIAHALSNICRFGGHSARFYSVAEHSVLLSREFFAGWHYKLVALLHDAAEAYLGDVPRPLKYLPEYAFYREAEDRLQAMILDKFCKFDWRSVITTVNDADSDILAHECHEPLIVEAGCEGFNIPDVSRQTRPPFALLLPWQAEMAFIQEFTRLEERQREHTSQISDLESEIRSEVVA